MGSLIIPMSGCVYVDSQSIIYAVEHRPKYVSLLDPLWQAVRTRQIEVITSELAILECLVLPVRQADLPLLAAYEQFFLTPGIRTQPISISILREAAQLRADIPRLKTPDAIHAATAMHEGCIQFITNDAGLRAIPGITVIILDDLLAVP